VRAVGVIPARYGSTRLPGKPLADICGKPLIQRVYERAAASGALDRLVVATDDDRIVEAVRSFGGEAVLTSPDHPDGTSRVAEAASRFDGDIVLNIQGDEPLLDPVMVGEAVALLAEDESALSATLCVPLAPSLLHDPAAVKVVFDLRGFAIYFSRSPIPYLRHSSRFEADFRPWMEPGQLGLFKRHLGIYAYRPAALQTFTGMAPHPLERIEMLEQLRALAAGLAIGVAQTPHLSLGVDTPEDVAPVEALLKAQGRLG